MKLKRIGMIVTEKRIKNIQETDCSSLSFSYQYRSYFKDWDSSQYMTETLYVWLIMPRAIGSMMTWAPKSYICWGANDIEKC